MFELEDRYPEDFRRTWNSQFRSGQDLEPNSWLHHYYAYVTGRAVPGQIRYDYFALDGPGKTRRMQRLAARRDLDVFCINDTDRATDRQRSRAAAWLRRYYPGRSEFERPPSPPAALPPAEPVP